MYGKIENGEFQFAPINFITPAGRTIINFHKKPAKLAEYGFLPVTESPIPEYDPENDIFNRCATDGGFVQIR